MANVEAVFLWMSGVVTPSIPSILQSFQAAPGSGHSTPAGLNQALERFSLGQLEEQAFCRDLAGFSSLPDEPALLRQRIIDACAPNEAVLAVVQKLPPELQRWLVVDLPRAWYEQIAGRSGFSEVFPAERLIFLSESGLPRLIPDLFPYLGSVAQLPTGSCLLIDPSQKRAIQGINLGFSTAHYVNPRHMEREFYLRGFFGKITIHKKPQLAL
ncbi:MAG TPA: hypothetical protein VF823_09800 [Anaerolineales bacterium]